MRKLAILLVFGGAVGFPSLALAVDTVTIQCTTFPGQNIFGIQNNSTITPPASCNTSATSSCAQCINDLRALANPFILTNVNGVDAESGYAGPYFVLQRN